MPIQTACQTQQAFAIHPLKGLASTWVSWLVYCTLSAHIRVLHVRLSSEYARNIFVNSNDAISPPVAWQKNLSVQSGSQRYRGDLNHRL